MSDTPEVGGDLKARLSKADSKVSRLESALSAARAEREELATAYRVLVKLGHIQDGSETADDGVSVPANERQSIVLALVPYGEQNAVAPRDVTTIIRSQGWDDINADYVRTTLWRFAQRDVLKSADGLYWRPGAPEVESVAAPGVSAPGADNWNVGPHGGGSGFPSTSPEGSIPSGSTPPSASAWDELDDDVPF